MPVMSLAEKLITESYEITIVSSCAEGNVTCESMGFQLKDIKYNKISIHTGNTVHSLCKDRVTPCRFQGHRFATKSKIYFIGTDNKLEVTNRINSAIAIESGQWIY